MVTSELKCINFVTSGLKCIHFNFSNVNVHIFIMAVCSLKAGMISQYHRLLNNPFASYINIILYYVFSLNIYGYR